MRFYPPFASTLGTLIILFMLACKSSENTGAAAGGPCTFEDSKQPITVDKIELMSDSAHYDIIFIWGNPNDKDPKNDSITFSKVNHRYVTTDELKKDSVVPGKVCSYIISRTISGSCDGKQTISLQSPTSK